MITVNTLQFRLCPARHYFAISESGHEKKTFKKTVTKWLILPLTYSILMYSQHDSRQADVMMQRHYFACVEGWRQLSLFW